MVTREHEAPIELAARLPAVISWLLAIAGFGASAASVEFELMTDRCTEMRPAELRADCVAAIKVGGELQSTVIIEVQRAVKPEKRRTWPSYVADVWRRTGKPVILLVICPDDKVAEWARQPIEIGPQVTLTPAAISPSMVPLVGRDDDQITTIDQAVFSAYMHSDGPHGEQALRALIKRLDLLDAAEAEIYIGSLEETLSTQSLEMLEELMSSGTHEFQTYSQKRYEAGRIETEQEAVLNVLATRGISVGAEALERIRSCRDFDLLKTWLIRAVTVDEVDAIFT